MSYSNQDNTSSGSVAVQDGGATLFLQGNRWRRTNETYNITPFTVVEFEFQSSSQGEIHGLGFDEDDTLNNGTRIFEVFGTQNWGNAVQVADEYTTADLNTYKSFRINVGQFYTGSSMFLVLVNDKDSGTANNTSWFRNIRIFEDIPDPGSCSVDTNFESGPAGWTNSAASTCSTGAFVVGTPSQVVNGGVTTQLAGDHTTGSGNAFFSAGNTSAGSKRRRRRGVHRRIARRARGRSLRPVDLVLPWSARRG